MRARPLVPAVAVMTLLAVGGATGTAAAGTQRAAAPAGSAAPTAPTAPGAPTVRADFNGDDVEDLAVGVPFEQVGDIFDAGTVNVLYGSPGGGLSGAGSQLFNQESAGITSDAEEGDVFGLTL